MKTIEIICDSCKKSFVRKLSEHKRNSKINRKNFCTRNCAGKNSFKHLELTNSETSFANHPERRAKPWRDQYTGFRDLLRRTRRRLCGTTINLEDLVEIWQNQKGICIYSKVQLKLPFYNIETNPIYTASLDRIDSKLGYIKGNIQFISIAMNHCKNSMSHTQMLELITVIKSSNNTAEVA